MLPLPELHRDRQPGLRTGNGYLPYGLSSQMGLVRQRQGLPYQSLHTAPGPAATYAVTDPAVTSATQGPAATSAARAPVPKPRSTENGADSVPPASANGLQDLICAAVDGLETLKTGWYVTFYRRFPARLLWSPCLIGRINVILLARIQIECDLFSFYYTVKSLIVDRLEKL